MSRLSVLEKAQLTPAFAELAEKNALTRGQRKKGEWRYGVPWCRIR